MPKTKQKFIFVFDSGVGGFSILKELIKILPYNYLYLADQAYFPYGNKSADWVKKRIASLVAYGINQNATAIVIACNTATVHGIEELRKKYALPIFGVEPVIKPLSTYQKAALLATKSTTSSLRIKHLIHQNFGQHLRVIGVHDLASAIEDMDENKIKSILLKLNQKLSGFEALGLSCTHYPLVKKFIQDMYPSLKLIDPSIPVALYVKSQLQNTNQQKLALRFVTTGNVLRLENQILHYLGIKAKVTSVKI